MTFDNLKEMFQRAFWLSFSRKKIFFSFLVLAFCGLLIVFCRGMAIQAIAWIKMSLTFLPIFLCTGILLSTGIVLIRLYHDEVKNRDLSVRKTLKKSWDLMLTTSYLCIPLFLAYLLLWIVLGIFYLLRQIPGIGDTLSIVLAFGPFLLILGSLILGIANIALLFFVTPAVALTGFGRMELAYKIINRVKKDILGNFRLLVIAIFPLLLVIGLLTLAAYLTEMSYFSANSALEIVLQWFFIMLPFSAVLAPAVIFFFNFAAESHVLMKKIDSHQDNT